MVHVLEVDAGWGSTSFRIGSALPCLFRIPSSGLAFPPPSTPKPIARFESDTPNLSQLDESE